MPAPVPRVPYVALGDSLTHGMRSGGLAWVSRHYSYPKQIAGVLGMTPFARPDLKAG